jgi:hypothetical protein
MIKAWYPIGGTLKRRGATQTDRSSLVPGTYMPDATTTGVLPGIPLTVSTGDITISTPGTTLENLDIYGSITVSTSDVTIRNCRIRGSAGKVGIAAYSANVARLLVEDCEITNADGTEETGLIGHDYTARRCNVYHCTDAFGAFNTTGPNTNVVLEANYAHDSQFFWPTTSHSDQMSHNDCIQVQGGANIHIVGNNFQAFIDPSVGQGGDDPSNPIYPSLAYMSGIILTPNVNAVSNVTIDRNWLAGGSAEINISNGSFGTIQGMTITSNRFVRTSGYTLLIPSDTRAVSTISGNVWNDDGTPIPIYNGS